MHNKPTLKLTGKIFYFSANLNNVSVQEIEAKSISFQHVSRATIIEDMLTFDFDEDEDNEGGVVKAFVYPDDRVLGKAHYKDRSLDDDKVDAAIYRNANGCMIIGKWWTGNIASSFIAELNYVDCFKDEKEIKVKGGTHAV